MSNDATVKFGYDGAALTAGLRNQEQHLGKFARSTETRFSRMSSGINNHLGKIGAGIGVIEVGRFIKGTLEGFDQIASESKKLNTTPETLQRIGSAAKILGNTDLETVSRALLKLRRQLIDEPTGEMAEGLSEIGFSAQEFLKLDADAQMLALADAMGKASENGRQLPVLTKAMGKNYAELIPLLSQGSAELKKFMDQAVVTSNSAIEGADELNDKWDVMAGKIAHVGKALAYSIGKGLSEMVGISPRTEIDHDGSRERAKNAERERELQAKRNAEAQAAAAAEIRAMKEKTALANAELEKKREAIILSEKDVELLEVQAKGQDRKIKKLQEAAFIEKRSHEFSAQGLDANASIKLAQREWDARENIDKRKKNGGRSHIGGVRESNKRLMGSGLDQFYRNQMHSETDMADPARPGYSRGANVPDYNAFDVPMTSMQKRGRMMGGPSSPLSERRDTRAGGASGAAAARAVAASKATDTGSKIDKTNEILTRGLLGG